MIRIFAFLYALCGMGIILGGVYIGMGLFVNSIISLYSTTYQQLMQYFYDSWQQTYPGVPPPLYGVPIPYIGNFLLVLGVVFLVIGIIGAITLSIFIWKIWTSEN
ncbi:MAG: hypothetical protein ACXQS8_08045 [Candidatus Helarchaeales archaeon]